MDDLSNTPLEILMDQLAFYTKEHIKMMREGAVRSDYQETKKMLHALTKEIESRTNVLSKKQDLYSKNSSSSDTSDQNAKNFDK